MAEKEAIALEDFLLPMLKIIPQERATAEQMINHYWLDMKSDDFTNKDKFATFIPDEDRFNIVVNQTDCFADVSCCCGCCCSGIAAEVATGSSLSKTEADEDDDDDAWLLPDATAFSKANLMAIQSANCA